MWVTRVIGTKMRRRPNTSPTMPSTRGWLTSDRIATTRSRTLPTWSPSGSKMGRPTSRAAYTRPGLAGPDCAVLTAAHGTGRDASSAVEIRGAGRAAAVGVALGHLPELALLVLVARVLGEVVVLVGVDAEPVELTAVRATLHPRPRSVDDAGVQRREAALDGVALHGHRPGAGTRGEPRHDVDAVDSPRRRRAREGGERRSPVRVGDRRSAHPSVRQTGAADVHRDPGDVAEVPELALEVVLAEDVAVVGGEHDVGAVQLVSLLQRAEGVRQGAVHCLERLDALVVGDAQLMSSVRRPRRVRGADEHLVRAVLLEHVRLLVQAEPRERPLVALSRP